MNKNIGTIDRTIRIIAALAVGILILTGTLSGPLAIILSLLAVVFVLTSSISFCPLYAPFKFSTMKKNPA